SAYQTETSPTIRAAPHGIPTCSSKRRARVDSRCHARSVIDISLPHGELDCGFSNDSSCGDFGEPAMLPEERPSLPVWVTGEKMNLSRGTPDGNPHHVQSIAEPTHRTSAVDRHDP